MNKPSKERIERAADAYYEASMIDISNRQPDAPYYDTRLTYLVAMEAALTADDSHLAAENAELRAEIDEQCRIIGKSSEREAKLLGLLQEAGRALARIESALAPQVCMASTRTEYPVNDAHYIAEQTLTKIRAERDEKAREE